MDEKKLRLGGMALANGVLVHGPTSWACAVRTSTGTLKVASGTKPKIAVSSDLPLLRGPARLLEAVLVLPRVRRELPEARFAFERRNVVAAMAAAGVASRAIRSPHASRRWRRSCIGGVIALAPALIALRGGELAAYHGAEHISIGTYEHGRGAAEGARALRLAPRRPADPRFSGRSRARGPRSRAPAQAGVARRLARCLRRVDRDLRLDGSPPGQPGREGCSPGRDGAAEPGRDG